MFLKIHKEPQIYKIAMKDKPPHVYGCYQDICQKWKITTNPDTNHKDILLGDRNRIWNEKKFDSYNEKEEQRKE